MLTAKQNLQEVIRGGTPERFVNQFEAIFQMPHPYMKYMGGASKGEMDKVNSWGVTNSFPANLPGSFPVHTPDKIVVKDIERWRDYVKAPPLKFSDGEWAACKAEYDTTDGTQVYKAASIRPGLFEHTHYLCEIVNALTYFITNPDEVRDLIRYITDWELELAEGICKHLKPDALFHHDDWGSEISTFISPDMFADFFLEPYKELYGYYHDHGVELVIHHSDSYAATLVPHMIEMGINIWQGCMVSNNIPELISKYGGKITFMGGIDNKFVDTPDWTQELCRAVVRKTCDDCGSKFFIPCITQGGAGSVYPGTYEALSEEIDRYSMEVFGIKESDISRLPPQKLI